MTISSIKTVGIYLRVSTEEQARHGFSIPNQRDSVTKFIRQIIGPAKIIEYEDNETASSTERPAYQSLLRDCRLGKIGAVVVWRTDRFTRNCQDGVNDLDEISVKLKIRFFSMLEGELDMKVPQSRYIAIMHMNNAEYERNRIIERVMPGMKRGARLGHYQGTRYTPYGTKYLKNEPNKRLEWVPSEVKVIEILFAHVSKGESVRSVAKYLYRQGYRNRAGKPFTTKMLGGLVPRELYADGYLRWNGIISEKPILEPIINRVILERAKRALNANKTPGSGPRRGSRRDDSSFILQGTLKCRRCGSNMVGHRAKGVRYYNCSLNRSRTSVACKGQYIRASVVEQQALEILKSAVNNEVVTFRAKTEMKRTMEEHNPELLNSMRLAEKDLHDIRRKKRVLLELYYEKRISKNDFQTENERLVQDERVIKENLARLEARRKTLQAQNINMDKVLGILGNFDTIYSRLQNKGKKDLFHSVFLFAHAVCYGPRKPTFICKYELNQPFKKLVSKICSQPKIKIKIIRKSSKNRLDTQLSPMAAR
ncbi:MAG: recombinase family protein [Elusimicrobiota bacterium]|jgi:site-specific DNA recombinase